MDDALRQVLAAYAFPPGPIDEPLALGSAGGLSGSRLWRLRSPLEELAVKAWRPGSASRSRIARCHAWQAKAAGLDYVPVPLRDRTGCTVVATAGTFWEVSPWKPGEASVTGLPALAKVRAAFASLAAVHAALADEARLAPSPGLSARQAEIRELLNGGFARLASRFRSDSDPGRLALTREWFGLAQSLAPRVLGVVSEVVNRPARLQPCLRDARPEHWLFTGDRVTGLVDYGAMGVESVAADLARLASEWLGGDPTLRAEAIQAYGTSAPLAAAEVDMMAAFEAASALLIGAHWARWHYVESRPFDDPGAVSRGLARSVGHLRRLAAQPPVLVL